MTFWNKILFLKNVCILIWVLQTIINDILIFCFRSHFVTLNEQGWQRMTCIYWFTDYWLDFVHQNYNLHPLLHIGWNLCNRHFLHSKPWKRVNSYCLDVHLRAMHIGSSHQLDEELFSTTQYQLENNTIHVNLPARSFRKGWKCYKKDWKIYSQ